MKKLILAIALAFAVVAGTGVVIALPAHPAVAEPCTSSSC